MEFRHLVSFLAIADELHFGRAAGKLHLAQPSLSQHLQRLEREVGVKLVARTSHEVRLTPAGVAFQVEAKRIIDQANRAVQAARDAAAGRAGTINIGYNFPAGQRVLQPTLLRLNNTHPGLTAHLWERRTGPQLKGLLSGELDIGFIFGLPPTNDLRSREVLRLPLVAVVGEQHDWACREQVAFRELQHQACVLFSRTQSPAMYDTIVTTAERVRINLRVAAEIDDPGATALVVATRPLVGFASVERARRTKGPIAIPLVDPVPMLSVHVVWRPRRSKVVDALLDTLDEAGPF
ncbi:LysR family transcriptional regulator [Candidatus Protofrankia californiensis]|uniref:LysR family transcriptional regulator n=1 Tax=Candidatus Protofrankia californiensis TaxID=1839754 RepID=UPI00104173FB|nr:LysR family transcriptional regulator [Candidatus Protofrankia californiensis]